jgi:hypothetical protein
MSHPKKSPAPAPLVFTRDELVVINNALNELCHGLPFSDEELQTRIGFPRDFARKVLQKVADALES